MKYPFLLLSSFLISTAVISQGNALLQAGDIGLRGGLKWSNSDNGIGTTDSELTLCLGGLYSVNPRIAAGLMIENESQTSEFEDSTDPLFNSSDSWNLTYVGPSARYYHPCAPNLNTYVGADVMFGFGNRELESSGSTTDTDISAFAFDLNFGLMWMASPKVGIEADFGGFRLARQTFGDGEPQTDLGFKAFSKRTRVGFSYFFNRDEA